LSDGGGQAFGLSNNVTFGKVNSYILTGSRLYVIDEAKIGTTLSDVHSVSGSLKISGSLISEKETYFRGGYVEIQSPSSGDGLYLKSGSSATVVSLTRSNSRATFGTGNGASNGYSFNTTLANDVVLINSDGSIRLQGPIGIAKIPSGSAKLDIDGDALISGSLFVTSSVGIAKAGPLTATLDVAGTATVSGSSFTVFNPSTSVYGYFINAFGTGRIATSNFYMYMGGMSGMGTIIQAGGLNNVTITTSSLSISGSVGVTMANGAGNVGIGKTSPINAKLDVNGNTIITGSLTVTGEIRSKTTDVYNVKNYGAAGNGSTNDTVAILQAISASQAAGGGAVFFPNGTYVITSSLTIPTNPQCDVALIGNGANVSIIKQTSNTDGIYFDMNDGTTGDQKYQVVLRGIGLHTSGEASSSIYITYGTSSVSAHENISVDINDVHILSDSTNYWKHGIILESAWNFRITNTMVVGKPTGSGYSGTGLEVRRMCVNGSVNQSQFNFWQTGLFVNTVDYTSAGMNTEGLYLNQIYMVPVNYGVRIKGNKSFFSAPFNSYDWAGRPIAGRMVLFGISDSHIDARNSGIPLLLENVQSHYANSNLFISDGTGSVVYGSNAHEGSLIGNTFFNAGTAPSVYIGGYSGSANIIAGNVFRGGSTHVLLESSSLYNKVYGNVVYDALNITIIDSGSYNLTGSVGN
jgi:hypothetical protein